MFFQKLFSRWKESFSVFNKQNLKVFVLTSLNNAKKSTLTMLKSFWWLLLLLPVSLVSALVFIPKLWIPAQHLSAFNALGLPFFGNIFLFFTTSFVFLFFLALLSFFLFLAVRSSVQNKDGAYFKAMMPKFWGFCLIFLMGSLFNRYLSFFAIFAPVIPYTIFFFLDQNGGGIYQVMVSIKNGIKFIFYYLPGLIVLSVINIFLAILFSLLFGFSSVLLFKFIGNILNFSYPLDLYFLLAIIVIPIVMVLFSCLFMSIFYNYYTRIIHKDYSLFYEK